MTTKEIELAAYELLDDFHYILLIVIGAPQRGEL